MTVDSTPTPRRIAELTLLIVIVSLSGGCGGPVENHERYADLIDDMEGKLYAHLDFKGTAITDSDLQELAFPDTVYSISLSHTGVTDEGAAELTRATQLERLDLTSTKITDQTLKTLEQLPNLRVAHVITLAVSREQYESLQTALRQRPEGNFSQLFTESFPRVPPIEAEPIFEDDPQAEEKIPLPPLLSDYAQEVQALDGDLQLHLELSDSSITDDDLINFPFPDSVRSISLRNTAVTDVGIAQLQRARNLESLDLRGTSVTLTAVPALKGIARLSSLNVQGTQIPPEAQAELQRYLVRHRATLPVDKSRARKATGKQKPKS